jgi:hypothetical protein
MVKGGKWFQPGRNGHEAGSSSGDAGRGFSHTLACPLRAHAVPRSERRVYIKVEVTLEYARLGVPLPWPDLHLPHW